MNVEEIYLCVKLGYCTRYRSASRLAFINETIRFFTQEFHLHSFIYDFHLAAINTNFLSSSPTGMLISQTAPIISKFLDEFVEFFLRIPIYSCNKVRTSDCTDEFLKSAQKRATKVYKLIHEKPDSSLIPHQFRLIFDFMIVSEKRTTPANDNENESSCTLTFKILYVFDNNIAIYSLVDNTAVSKDYSKFLVIKIENFNKETTNSSAPAVMSSSMHSSSLMENSVIVADSSSTIARPLPQQHPTMLRPVSTARLTHSASSASLAEQQAKRQLVQQVSLTTKQQVRLLLIFLSVSKK